MCRQFLVFIVLVLTCVGSAQEDWISYPPAVLDAEQSAALDEADQFLRRCHFEPARAIYLRLADEHPGTSLGARALEAAAYTYMYTGSSGDDFDSLLLRIIEEYPNSDYEIRARFHRVQDQVFNSSSREKLTAYSEFLADRGAPRMEALFSGHGFEEATQRLLEFHPEIRYALSRVYYGGTFLVEDDKEAANLARFGRGAFGTRPYPNGSFSSQLHSVLKHWRGKDVGHEPSRPDITIVSPTPGSTVGPSLKVSFLLSSGDYRKAQVNLAGLSLKVDGVEQVLNASIFSEIDDTMTEGVTFEVLTVNLATTLSPGAHIVEVDVHTGRGAPSPESSTTVIWPFTVSED